MFGTGMLPFQRSRPRGNRVLIACLALLVACTPATPPGPAAPVVPVATTAPKRAERQVVRVSVDNLPASASPESSTQIPMFWTQFDPLVQFDDNLNILPAAATRWESLPNGAGWRFSLRRDLVFSNGDPVTGADLEFTVKNMIANRTANRASFANVTDAKMVDEYTVDLVTRQFDISVLYNGIYLWVMPKKYYEQVGKDGYATKPIGSGPYELAEYRPEQSHTYRLRTDRPHPYRKPILTEIRWQRITDSTASVNGIRTGDLDIVTGAFNPDQAETLKREGVQVAAAVSTNALLVVDKNTNERLATPLLDKRVRQALNYAVDKQAIAQTVYRGFSIPTGQLSTPGSLMWDEGNKPIPYDPTKAKELLAQAGYPNGFKLASGIDYSGSFSGAGPMLLAVQDYWRRIGVDVPLNVQELSGYIDRLNGRDGKTRSEIVMFSSGDANGMYAVGRNFFLCSLPVEARVVCLPEFDRNLNLAFAELDPAKRRDLMRAANKAFIDELPAFFLLINPVFRFATAKVQNFPAANASFWNLDTVYLSE